MEMFGRDYLGRDPVRADVLPGRCSRFNCNMLIYPTGHKLAHACCMSSKTFINVIVWDSGRRRRADKSVGFQNGLITIAASTASSSLSHHHSLFHSRRELVMSSQYSLNGL